MNKDNNNKNLEKYLPKSSVLGIIIQTFILGVPILIFTYLINGISALMLIAIAPLLFCLYCKENAKEKRAQYINMVHLQEERYSVEFSDVGIEYISKEMSVSNDWLIAGSYALYKDYVSDIKYTEGYEYKEVPSEFINPKIKTKVYRLSIKTTDNTEYILNLDERYQAERMITWFERKIHERNNQYKNGSPGIQAGEPFYFLVLSVAQSET